jgi:hypothetical protein
MDTTMNPVRHFIQKKNIEDAFKLFELFCQKYQEGYRCVVTNQHNRKMAAYLEIYGFTYDLAEVSRLKKQHQGSTIHDLELLKNDRYYFIARSIKPTDSDQ